MNEEAIVLTTNCKCGHCWDAHAKLDDDESCLVSGCVCVRFRQAEQVIAPDPVQAIFQPVATFVVGSTPDRPAHYQSSKFEVIEIIEEFGLDFLLGNAAKYLLRAGKKDGNSKDQDLSKAEQYIHRARTGEWK